MKQYFTGFFTSACLVVSAVMFMGASGSSEIGKYQLSTTYEDTQKVVYEIILDTKTGKIVKRSEMKTGEYNKYQYFEY